MGTGYTRNDSSNNIANGNVIDAADLDGEFDAIQTAFGTSGHTHDGTSAEGGAVSKLGPAQEFIGDGSALYPKSDATYDLGKAAASFNKAYLESLNFGGTDITATAVEINYSDGVTANLQTQLNDKQPLDGDLTAIAALSNANSNFIVGNGTAWVAESGATARTSLGLGTAATTASTDYATAAQGTKADAALPLAGGTVTGDINFGDDDKAVFGANSDLQIYSDGTHSYFKETGSGNLWIGGANIGLGNPTASEYFIECENNAAVKLYYDSAEQLATTSTGINVSGNVAVTGTVDGVDIAARDGILTSTTTTADAALPKAGGAMTGAITTNSTFDGRNVSVDGAKLDNIEASANNYVHPTTAGNKHIPTAGAANQVLTYLSSGTAQWSDPSGGGMEFVRKTANYTASHLEGIIADTSGGTFTITLPSSPTTGDYVTISDGADWATVSLTVGRNGSTIEGDAEDMTMDIGGTYVTFLYDGTTWQVHATIASDTGAYATATQGATADSALQPTGDGSSLTGIGFLPVEVTGATPSLDVGSYNFFDNGELAANTTVSFASVPTEANWRYSYDSTNIADTWDVTTAAYSAEFSTSAFGDATYKNGAGLYPSGMHFKPDGTKLYVVAAIDDLLTEYDLSTAWDITTVSFVQSYNIGLREATPNDVSLSSDGTKMYITGHTGDDVNEYDLSTAWDISTAVYGRVKGVSTWVAYPSGMFFKPDGTEMYLMDYTNDDVTQFTLSTPWLVTSATFVSQTDISNQETRPYGVAFSTDGTKMFITGIDFDSVHQYTLSTAWDITTTTYTSSIGVSLDMESPRGVAFNDDGSKMYVSSYGAHGIYEYSLGTVATVTLPAAVENSPKVTPLAGQKTTLEFSTIDAGVTVKLIGEEVV